MESQQEINTTVQGFGYPVPAALEGERAGSQPSRSNDRNVPVVGNLATEADNATSQPLSHYHNGYEAGRGVNVGDSDTQSPFSRSGKIPRSPTKGAPGIINKRPRSSPPVLNGANAPLKRQCDNERNNTYVEGQESSSLTNFQKLGEQIRKLVEMLEDGKRRSIHQPMRDTIESIRNLYKLSGTESHVAVEQVIRKTNSSQTSPWQKPLPGTSKGLAREAEGPKPSTQLSTPGKAKTTAINDADVIPHGSATNTNEASNEVPLTANDEGWQTIRGKKKRKRKKSVRQPEAQASKPRWKAPRPDAIIITKTSEDSYADILKKMKANPELNELGEQVNKIRKTAKGELLLELKRGNGEQQNKLRQHAEQALVNLANVRTVSHEILIECRDIDEVTTREEICTAIQDQFTTTGTVNSSAIKSLRPTRYGTQTALISLPARSAQMLIKAGRIRIGWVRCRLRELITPTRCFRCLGYGHVARDCKSEVDRTGACFKCGGKGHVAKNCEEPPKCVLCEPDCTGGNKHSTGNKKCLAYKKALEVVTTRND